MLAKSKETRTKRPIDTQGEIEKERERYIYINKIEIDTHLFVKLNQQIKLGRFGQNITEKVTLQENVTRKGYLVYYYPKR